VDGHKSYRTKCGNLYEALWIDSRALASEQTTETDGQGMLDFRFRFGLSRERPEKGNLAEFGDGC
jgi:hypothetical protein